MGYQSNPLAWYKYADIFVFPSAWEGFPIALGEAMSVGIPVISSNCPTGPIELIEPNWQKVSNQLQYPYYAKAGALMPIPDVKQKGTISIWANTILQVLNNKHLRESLSMVACKRMDELDVEKVKTEWMKLILKDYI
jgi:glycosyltransferase involved in cell wall biosynthesis